MVDITVGWVVSIHYSLDNVQCSVFEHTETCFHLAHAVIIHVQLELGRFYNLMFHSSMACNTLYKMLSICYLIWFACKTNIFSKQQTVISVDQRSLIILHYGALFRKRHCNFIATYFDENEWQAIGKQRLPNNIPFLSFSCYLLLLLDQTPRKVN